MLHTLLVLEVISILGKTDLRAVCCGNMFFRWRSLDSTTTGARPQPGIRVLSFCET